MTYVWRAYFLYTQQESKDKNHILSLASCVVRDKPKVLFNLQILSHESLVHGYIAEKLLRFSGQTTSVFSLSLVNK